MSQIKHDLHLATVKQTHQRIFYFTLFEGLTIGTILIY